MGLFTNKKGADAAIRSRFRGSDINVGGFGGVDVTRGPNKRSELDIQTNIGPLGQADIGLGTDLKNFGASGILNSADLGQFGLGGDGADFFGSIFEELSNIDVSGGDLSGIFAGLGGDIGLDFLLNNDFSDIADQTTNILRDQAQPFQDRRATELADNLFSRGGLGASGVAQPAFFDWVNREEYP